VKDKFKDDVCEGGKERVRTVSIYDFLSFITKGHGPVESVKTVLKAKEPAFQSADEMNEEEQDDDDETDELVI
jgi:hypothetical protein